MKNEPSKAIYSQLCDYVMSRGARDCSIIISLREIGSRGEDRELEGIPFLSLSIISFLVCCWILTERDPHCSLRAFV